MKTHFNKQRDTDKKSTTAGFYFGSSESEGESSYNDSDDSFFDDYLDVLPQIEENRCFIISGRKGAGKSAVAKYYNDNATPINLRFCELIKSSTINLEQQIQNSTEKLSAGLDSFFQWVILVKLVKLILKAKEGSYTTELKAIRNFVEKNTGVVDIDKFDVLGITEIAKNDVGIEALTNIISFKAIINRILGKNLKKAPYYKLLPALKEIVYKVLGFPVFKNYQFIVIFDDLDLRFKSNNVYDKQSLLNLIRTAKEFNNDLRGIGNTKILIVLRDDIKKVLSGFDADVSKIFSSYEVVLKWYDGLDESKTLLRDLANDRIAKNFEKRGINYNRNDPWMSLFNDTEGCYGKDLTDYKSAFKYILEYTFLRPRDIILFLKIVAQGKYIYPINGSNIGIILQKYAKEVETELKGELAIHYSQEQILSIWNILRGLSFSQRDGFSKQVIIAELEKQGLDNAAFQILVDYCLLTPFDPETMFYYLSYRDADPSDADLDSDSLSYKLHKCVYASFVPRSTLPKN